MISVEIEKEINQENKVVMNFNLRQFICIIILVVFSIFAILFMKMSIDIVIYPITFVAVLLYAFGWYKPNGVPFEKIFIKKIQAIIYGSNTRKYKTKNQYVTMVNEEYNRRRNIDLADKKIKKQIEKEQKDLEKELKQAAKTSVCQPVK